MILLVLLAIAATAVVWLWPRDPYRAAVDHDISVERAPNNPMIHADLDASLQAQASEGGYVNINWPSLIRVPAWVDNPLGKYYLYFSHHKGDRMRLAYADDILGPWHIHVPGVLPLEDSGFPSAHVKSADPGQALKDIWQNFSVFIVRDYLILNHQASVRDQQARKERGIATAQQSEPHIASPEVVVDHDKQRLLMFYHGLEYGTRQLSRVAESSDGIDFLPLDGTIPSPYLRHFEFRDQQYLLGMPGVLFRAKDAAGPYEPRRHSLFEPRMRHMGVWVDGKPAKASRSCAPKLIGKAPTCRLCRRYAANSLKKPTSCVIRSSSKTRTARSTCSMSAAGKKRSASPGYDSDSRRNLFLARDTPSRRKIFS